MARIRGVMMPPVQGGAPLYRRADVGLAPDRPFRFCTMRWDAPADRGVLYHGDTAGILRARCVELDMAEGSHRDDVPLHAHEFYEFVFCRGGSGWHTTLSGEAEFTRGRVAMVLPGALHGFRRLARTVKTNLYLEKSWFQRELWLHASDKGLVRTLLARSLFAVEDEQQVLLLDLPEPALRECEVEFDKMRDEALHDSPSLLSFNAGFLKVLSILASTARDAGLWQGESLNPVVWRAARRIEDMIEAEQPFALGDFAGALGLSSTHLNRLFREHAATTPARLYQARRLHHACRLLSDGADSLAGIAARLHFSDQSHFTRCFRDALGVSPGKFRDFASRNANGSRAPQSMETGR